MAIRVDALTAQDVPEVLAKSLPEYHAEYLPLGGLEVFLTGALWQSAWVARRDEEPIAVYGIMRHSPLSRDGTPWAILMKGFSLSDLRYGRAELTRIAAGYRVLSGASWASHKNISRFLRFLGFRIEEPIRWNGMNLLRFSMDVR